MGRWAEAAKNVGRPVQKGQIGAVRSETTPEYHLTDPNCTNCTDKSNEPVVEYCFYNGDPDGDCITCGDLITEDDKVTAIPCAEGGYIHGSCYRQWFDQCLRGRFTEVK